MQALKDLRSSGQNFERMSWRGALSSSRAKLRTGDEWAGGYLLDDSLIDESGVLLGTTEHVAHVFHWHFLRSLQKNIIIMDYHPLLFLA